MEQGLHSSGCGWASIVALSGDGVDRAVLARRFLGASTQESATPCWIHLWQGLKELQPVLDLRQNSQARRTCFLFSLRVWALVPAVSRRPKAFDRGPLHIFSLGILLGRWSVVGVKLGTVGGTSQQIAPASKPERKHW